MSDLNLFLFYIILFIGIIVVFIIKSIFDKVKYCNSNYNCADVYDKLEIDEPEYKVHAVREVCTKNKGPRMAEYILWNFYLDNKNSVKSQELIIYDEVGKYQIGDKLKFTKT